MLISPLACVLGMDGGDAARGVRAPTSASLHPWLNLSEPLLFSRNVTLGRCLGRVICSTREETGGPGAGLCGQSPGKSGSWPGWGGHFGGL